MSIEEIVERTAMARSTIVGYLTDFIAGEHPDTIDPWVEREEYDVIAPVVDRHGTERLKPIYEELEGRMSYDTIRLVVSHVVARTASAGATA